jgi:hypothetical protein
VISVDTKKKELVGDFASEGREYHPEGKPEKVRVRDFIDKTLRKAIPYGVYDLAANVGWVSVGTTRHVGVRGRVDTQMVAQYGLFVSTPPRRARSSPQTAAGAMRAALAYGRLSFSCSRTRPARRSACATCPRD